jgi:dihydroneopterin aldolase
MEGSGSAVSGKVSGSEVVGLDSIRISGIRHYGYTGFFPEEQVLGQWFEVNLTLWLDLATTGANDQLENTLNYAEVVAAVTAVMDAARFKTLEKLNTAILDRVLAFAPVIRVHSDLVKLSPPIPGFNGQITISMTRGKAGGV